MSYLTEEEASKETCPFIRFRIRVSDISLETEYVHQMCQGSACRMAWRWKDPDGTGHDRTPNRLGYCGIAGRPSRRIIQEGNDG